MKYTPIVLATPLSVVYVLNGINELLTKARFLHDKRKLMLTTFILIGGYSPEVRAFVTLIRVY